MAGVGERFEAQSVANKTDEREVCGGIMGEVIDLWDKGNHNLDGKVYKQLREDWSKNGCDNLDGFPPFGKIPKS